MLGNYSVLKSTGSAVRVEVLIEENSIIDQPYIEGNIVDLNCSRAVIESEYENVRRFSIPLIGGEIDVLLCNQGSNNVRSIKMTSIVWYDSEGNVVYESDPNEGIYDDLQLQYPDTEEENYSDSIGKELLTEDDFTYEEEKVTKELEEEQKYQCYTW